MRRFAREVALDGGRVVGGALPARDARARVNWCVNASVRNHSPWKGVRMRRFGKEVALDGWGMVVWVGARERERARA